MPLQRFLDEMRALFLRRGFYRYDFFEGTHKLKLPFKYMLGGRRRRDWIAAYEQSAAAYVGAKHAVGFGSGRMALYAILDALRIGPEDEIILPAFTCVVVPNAVLYRGAKPVYVDIRKDGCNIDPDKIEAAITPRTRAILAQHTFGRPCAIEAVMEIARKHGLKVIEDCAHAFGASHRGRKLGTFGDAAFASTDHTKVLSTGLGGIALCSSPQLARELRRIQGESSVLPRHARLRIFFQYGLLAFLARPGVYWAGKLLTAALGRIGLVFYFDDELQTARPRGYPYRLGNFQAFVGWHEIQDLDRNLRHRREIARGYDRLFGLKSSDAHEGACLRYSLLVDSPRAWERALGKYFTVGRWFSSVAQGRTRDFDAIAYREGSCPVAEFAASHIINFPTHDLIDSKAMERLKVLLERSRLPASERGGLCAV